MGPTSDMSRGILHCDEIQELSRNIKVGLFIEHPRTATLDRAIAEARGSDAGLNAERDNQIVASSDSGKR